MSLELVAFVLFGITVAERILELKVSHRNAAWSFERGGVEYGAAHYKWMVAMHTGFLVAMVAEYLMYGSSLPSVVLVSAIVVAGACQLMRWWIINTLGSQWNTRVIVVPGAGRVSKGPYRFLKHPNYVVVATEMFTLPLIFGSWRTAIIFSALNAWMMWVRLRVENRAIQQLVLTKAS
ncbi:MAG: hypothetical protein FJ146_14365 [Deltaproteobacteria bacterium]|nr:hypothetical protein [Deltaproteobacteria bacterium]